MDKKIFIILILISCLNACKNNSSHLSSSKSLKIATGAPIGDITPFSSRFGIGSNLSELVYYPLFRIGPNDEIINVLAEKTFWDESSNELHVILKEPLSHDVKETFEKVKSEAQLENIKSIEVLSKNEVVFRLTQYDRLFLFQISVAPIIASSRKDSTTGEFLVTQKSEDHVVLQRKIKSPTKVNEIEVYVIPSPRRALRALVSGDIDFLLYFNVSEYDIISDLPEFKIQDFSTKTLMSLLENRHHAFNQSKFDLAGIGTQLNRHDLLKAYGGPFLDITSLSVSEDSRWWDESLSLLNQVATNSPKRSFEKNNTKNKVRTLSFLSGQEREKTLARMLKRQLESLGLAVNLEEVSQSEYQQKILRDQNFDLQLVALKVQDPFIWNYYFFNSESKFKYIDYSNKIVDRYLDEARYNKNFNEAKTSFISAIKQLKVDAPSLFLFWVKMPVVYRKSCSGFHFNASDFFSSLKDVHCEL